MNRNEKRSDAAGIIRLRMLLCGLLALCMLTACTTVGPDYVRPDLPVPDTWQKNIDAAAEDDGLADWWRAFNDPVLNTLMSQAMAENLDLQTALSTVRQARISRGIADADRYPSVNSSGSARRTYRNDAQGDFSGTDSFSLGLDASWELDIFGGVRRSLEASDAELASTEESYRDVLVSLLAEVAMNYVELRSYQSQLAVAEANLSSQEETWKITQWRWKAGLTTELDVEKARSNLEQTRANIPNLRSGIEQAMNSLAVLLGSYPGELDAELSEYKPLPTPPEEIAVGIPADLLRRRPDLRKVERDLAAQTARIGVAKSNLYPSFSLSGSVGLDALSAGDLLDGDSFSTGVGSMISWPVFRAGAIIRNIELQWEIQEQRLLAYRKALLVALKDVENGLTLYAYEKESRESLQVAYQAAEHAAEISKVQYASGLVDFTTVLDSDRTLLSLQNQLTQSDAQIIKNLISLYKALGGGWQRVATDGG